MPELTTVKTAYLSASSMPVKPATILAVDDDRALLILLKHALEMQGHNVVTARTGEEALATLKANAVNIDAIILDREMPGLSGLDVARKMRNDPGYSAIPVIMLTSSGQPEEVQQGIEAGVFYYLVKPTNDAILKSVIGSALRERRHKMALVRELNRHDVALKAIRSCHLEVRTLSEAEDVACLLAASFPDPERVVTGLLELLFNAVEHGNLGISFEEKAKHIIQNDWREEVTRRLLLPENENKVAEVIFQRREDGCFVQITDSGKGFDWRKYLLIDPARATESHGRGIARARLMAFDKLAYNEVGNQVTAVVNHDSSGIDW